MMSCVSHTQRSRAAAVWLVIIVVGFLLFRVPFVLKLPGGMDEQWFSVPGYTVASEGIPRIPFVPARNPDVVFYRADEMLFALPPGLAWLQAPFYRFFAPGYPTSRVPSLLAGVCSIVLVYLLGRDAFGDRVSGILGAALYSISRVLFFPATVARPDMACCAFGLAAVWFTVRPQRGRDMLRPIVIGVLLGSGLLMHPFAVVFCLQVAAWVLFAGKHKPIARFRTLSVAGATSLLILALWLPLILARPELFRSQFFNNVLNRAGPGLLERLLFPWTFVDHQARLVLDLAGTTQVALMIGGIVTATVVAAIHRNTSCLPGLVLGWSSMYLLTACQGAHPTKSYWCYSGAFLILSLGWSLSTLIRSAARWGRRTRWPGWVFVGLIFVAMIPGSGIRTWIAWQQHRGNRNYDGRQFVRHLLAELPAEGHYVVDPAYVLDFHVAGRDTVLNVETDDYYLDAAWRYDFLVVSRDGLEKGDPVDYDGRLYRTFGVKNDLFSCYAEVYRPAGANRRRSPSLVSDPGDRSGSRP